MFMFWGKIARKKVKRKPVSLLSVQNMVDDIETNTHEGLKGLFRRHTFVGCVGESFVLLQHETKLHLISLPRFR